MCAMRALQKWAQATAKDGWQKSTFEVEVTMRP
jgi:hypothetical protein